MTENALERRYSAATDLPRAPFATLPTPARRLEELGEALDMPELYVKDDGPTGELYGGNKVRKLEYLLGEAVAEGHDEVWTVGAIGSHHVLATCIYARQQGLTPAALHYPQPVTNHVLDNLRALSTTKPELTLVGNKAQIPIEVLRTKIREWLARGPEVYYVPAGGSSPTGVVGYVNAVCELAEQIEEGALPRPDVIFAAAGTVGTLSGILVGTQLVGLDCEVVGVRVVDRIITNKPAISNLASRTVSRLEAHGVPTPEEIDTDRLTLLHDYFGEQYGTPTPEGMEAIEAARETEGLELEPTYTGKTMAGLIAERDRMGLRDRTVLYWHTLSSVDLSDRIDRARIDQNLPEEYGAFFDGTFQG